MRRVAVCVIAMSVLMLAVGCKKSVKGENQRWKSTTKMVDELKVYYPGFAPALTEQYTKAKAIMDAAEKIEDEDDRIKKMSEANNLLATGFVTELAAVDAKKKAIQAKIVEISAKAADKADRAGAQQAAENAKKAMADVEAALKRGAPDAKTAAILVKKVTGDLQAAEQLLGTVANIAQQKKDAKDPKAGVPATGAAPASTTPPQAEPWTCAYCDHVNQHDHTECANCGAARSVKQQ